jgi:signal transduction histidine kinase
MIPVPDLLIIVGLALGTTTVVGAVGGLSLYGLRTRSVHWLVSGLAVVTVLSTLAAVVVVARAMFISPHDLGIVIAVVVSSGVGGLVVALLLGRVVTRGGAELVAAARTLGAGRYEHPARPLPAELASVSAEMQDADEALQASRRRESALEESRRELVAWVSHDLRSPLAGVRAMAEALEDGIVTTPEDRGRYYTNIRRETDRLAVMVDDLFELSRIHAQVLRLAVAQVGVADLVSDLLAAADPIAHAQGVLLRGSARTEAAVDVDAREMSRALHNLVANAIRHTPSDGIVSFTASATDEHAFFTVEDACGGIPAGDLARVFDVAFRGEAARTPARDSGGGLGLAIARGIVEAHAGEIQVRNAGDGCCFEVRLPLAGIAVVPLASA